MTKKEFVLQQIAPYWKNPALCGYEHGGCKYLTTDGRMCVAGKNMINPSSAHDGFSILSILNRLPQKEVFKPEAVGILTTDEWYNLQLAHDHISKDDYETALINLNKIILEITKEELDNYEIPA